MISSNFHTHSNLVDGKNSLEEIVLSAIGLNFTELGFSEHAYVSFDPGCCLSKEDTLFYRKEVKRLKEKYEGKIKLFCGIEADFYSEDDFSAYDYVIGSVHYLKIGDEFFSVDVSPEETLSCINEKFGGSFSSYASCYFETVSKIYEKTHADIIGHFDLLKKFSNRGVVFDFESPSYISSWQSAMKALYNKSVFEVNTGAVSRGYLDFPYPSLNMLEELKRLGGRIVFSSDSHSADSLNACFDKAQKTAEKAGFNAAGFIDRNNYNHIQL